MKNYYQIMGINKNATTEEIKQTYNKIKMSNQLTVDIHAGYHILNDKTKRKIYDELCDKIKSLSKYKVPFFGYDFDEKYTHSFEQKRYLIDNNRYLIYEKENNNGTIIKNYYIEDNGKLNILSENDIKKIKKEYYEQKSLLLKDSLLNKVLPK
jgi:DnaJ-class molecular chaperone